jgi:hypothetical protein
MTAINPPKILQDNLVNFDGFTASAPLPKKKLEAKIKVQSIVRARAAF